MTTTTPGVDSRYATAPLEHAGIKLAEAADVMTREQYLEYGRINRMMYPEPCVTLSYIVLAEMARLKQIRKHYSGTSIGDGLAVQFGSDPHIEFTEWPEHKNIWSVRPLDLDGLVISSLAGQVERYRRVYQPASRILQRQANAERRSWGMQITPEMAQFWISLVDERGRQAT